MSRAGLELLSTCSIQDSWNSSLRIIGEVRLGWRPIPHVVRRQRVPSRQLGDTNSGHCRGHPRFCATRHESTQRCHLRIAGRFDARRPTRRPKPVQSLSAIHRSRRSWFCFIGKPAWRQIQTLAPWAPAQRVSPCSVVGRGGPDLGAADLEQRKAKWGWLFHGNRTKIDSTRFTMP
jgi:hypothetical protein